MAKQSKAQSVHDQIISVYRYDGRYYPPKTDDLIRHLKQGKVDSNVPAVHQSDNYDGSDDDSMYVFYFDDKSVLSVRSGGVYAPW